MWDDGKLIAEITRILYTVLVVEADADCDLLESGALDSVGVVRLLLEIERSFGVRLPVDELAVDDIRTVRGIAASITRRTSDSLDEIGRAMVSGALREP